MLVRNYAVTPGHQIAVVLYSEKFAKQREPAVRFMKAYILGARFYNDAFVKKQIAKRAEAIEILAKATKIDPALFDTMVLPGINPAGRVNLDSLPRPGPASGRKREGGNMRIVLGVAGSSSPVYGIRTLEALKEAGVETHLVVSDGAKRTIPLESRWTIEKIEALATVVYDNHDLAASISSGSFRTDGMIVAPCSMKTLAAIAYSFTQDLLARAADVTLKERRKLVLVPRETPLHLGHLRNMVRATELGAVILPPVPAFYHAPKTIDDLINQTVGKILDQFQIEHALFKRWQTPEES